MTYAAAAVSLGVTTLTNCAAFRTLVGAANPTAALAFVVKTWSGAPENNSGTLGAGKAADGTSITLGTPPYAVIGMTGLQKDPGGVGNWDISGTVEIRLYLPKVSTGEAPAVAAARAMTTAGTIAEQIEAQVGASTGFADADVQLDGPYMDEEGPYRAMTVFLIAINFRG